MQVLNFEAALFFFGLSWILYCVLLSGFLCQKLIAVGFTLHCDFLFFWALLRFSRQFGKAYFYRAAVVKSKRKGNPAATSFSSPIL